MSSQDNSGQLTFNFCQQPESAGVVTVENPSQAATSHVSVLVTNLSARRAQKIHETRLDIYEKIISSVSHIANGRFTR